MARAVPNPDQLALGFGKDAEIERIIEARVAIRAEAQAIRWRLRLVVIETVMMAALVVAAGVALDQPIGLVLRGAALVGLGCFVTGSLLIAMSAVTGRIIAHFHRWRAAQCAGKSARQDPDSHEEATRAAEDLAAGGSSGGLASANPGLTAVRLLVGSHLLLLVQSLLVLGSPMRLGHLRAGMTAICLLALLSLAWAFFGDRLKRPRLSWRPRHGA